MTINGGQPHRVGDHDQRYKLEAYGYPVDGFWGDVAYSDNLSRVVGAGEGLLTHPCCSAYRVFDRVLHKIVYSGGVQPDGSDNVIENHGIGEPLASDEQPG